MPVLTNSCGGKIAEGMVGIGLMRYVNPIKVNGYLTAKSLYGSHREKKHTLRLKGILLITFLGDVLV